MSMSAQLPFDALNDALKAAGEGTRLRVLALLAEGELTGTTVTCPWHGWQFNVTTGSTLRNSEIAVPAYRVEVRGNAVFVELP